jgi:hypothetical protein
MRSERVLQRLGLPARLVPGPREVSPNCGVAVAFVWEDEPQVVRALSDAKIRFEAIHHYELDDDSRPLDRAERNRQRAAADSAPVALGGGSE